jgi:hypothetical protein
MDNGLADKKTLYYAGLAVLLVISAYVVLVQTQIFGPKKETGDLVISGIDKNTKVFIDSEKAQVAVTSNGGLVKTAVGRRAIIVSRDNFWPWLKYLDITAVSVSEIHPFNLPKTVQTDLILSDDPEYDSLVSTIQKNTVPVSSTPIYSPDDKIAVYALDGTLYARSLSNENLDPIFCLEKCETEFVVFRSDLPIKNVAFLGGRSDVVLFSAGPLINAIELDRRQVQNFEPVYQGENPSFYKSPDNTLYVLDTGKLLRLSL